MTTSDKGLDNHVVKGHALLGTGLLSEILSQIVAVLVVHAISRSARVNVPGECWPCFGQRRFESTPCLSG